MRVVDRGGFAGAAREVGVPTSTVSRAIARLEAGTGVRLLHRTTRSMRPTSEGRELYASIAPAIATVKSAARALEPATRKPKGRLRVAAPSDLCAGFLADVIVAFMERHPLVQLDFALSNQHTNLVDEGFDVAVRAAAHLGDSSLIARKLGDLEHRLYASPRYLERYGAPASVDDLGAHRCVVFRAKDLARTWALYGAAGDAERARPRPRRRGRFHVRARDRRRRRASRAVRRAPSPRSRRGWAGASASSPSTPAPAGSSPTGRTSAS